MDRRVGDRGADSRDAARQGLLHGERITLRRDHAAEALDVRVDFFDKYVAPELRAVRVGRRRLYPVRDLRAWVDQNAERVSHGVVPAVAVVFAIRTLAELL